MPAPCVVPKCSGADPSRFGFPTNPEINLKWRIAIKKEVKSTATSSSGGPQKTLWKPSKTSKICGAHFKPDRGIVVQDLFACQDVKVNTPCTMKGRTQLPAEVVVEDRTIASKRVHVERIIGLAKTYKMISTKMEQSRVPMEGRIIFVCFALSAILE